MADIDTGGKSSWRVLNGIDLKRPCPAIKLPGRFRGGLLFGQLVPRFENRIIARCPMTYERIYQRVLTATAEEAYKPYESKFAQFGIKMPK